MQERADTSESCARADDLIAYLYGEASPLAAKDFEAHAEHCVSCRTEMASFGQVRESIRDWRQQVLSLPALEAAAVPFSDAARAVVAPSRQRSALGALREFFSLSPMWMRAATAALSVCICALVLMAIAQAEVRWDSGGFSFRTGASRERVVERTRTVEVEKRVGFSQAEVEQLVADRVQKERESWQQQQPPPKVINTSAPSRSTSPARNTPQPTGDVTPRNASRQTVAQRAVSDEEDLPRLYDLLDESN